MKLVFPALWGLAIPEQSEELQDSALCWLSGEQELRFPRPSPHYSTKLTPSLVPRTTVEVEKWQDLKVTVTFLKIRAWRPSAHVEPEATVCMDGDRELGAHVRKAHVSHASGSLPWAACWLSFLKKMPDKRQTDLWSSVSRKEVTSHFLAPWHQLTVKANSAAIFGKWVWYHPCQLSAFSHPPQHLGPVIRAAPFTSWMGPRNDQLFSGGPREQRRPKTLNLPLRWFQWRLCNVGEQRNNTSGPGQLYVLLFLARASPRRFWEATLAHSAYMAGPLWDFGSLGRYPWERSPERPRLKAPVGLLESLWTSEQNWACVQELTSHDHIPMS